MKDWHSREIKQCIRFFKKQRGRNLEVIHLDGLDDMITIRELTQQIRTEVEGKTNFIVIVYLYSAHTIRIRELVANLDYNPMYYSRIFFHDELLISPLDNILVPIHEKCNADDILTKYNITISQLPKLLASDPIVRWNGWNIGDVIKIYREDEVYYRVIVNHF